MNARILDLETEQLKQQNSWPLIPLQHDVEVIVHFYLEHGVKTVTIKMAEPSQAVRNN